MNGTDKQEALRAIQCIVEKALRNGGSIREKEALEDSIRKGMVQISKEELNQIHRSLKILQNYVASQKQEIEKYEAKLDRHMERMEIILTSFMESIRKDMERLRERSQ